jgi:hypothetical protein
VLSINWAVRGMGPGKATYVAGRIVSGSEGREMRSAPGPSTRLGMDSLGMQRLQAKLEATHILWQASGRTARHEIPRAG